MQSLHKDSSDWKSLRMSSSNTSLYIYYKMSNLSVTQKMFFNVLFVTSQVRYVGSIVKMVAGYTGLPAKTTNVRF